jgi:lysozyme
MAMSAQDFRLGDKGLALIQEFEGWKRGYLGDDRWKAYLDTLPKKPVWTIYYGLTKGVHEGMVITRAQGDEMMKRELISCETALESMVSVPLNANQADACISLIYNMGPGSPSDTKHKRGFYWSTLRRLINQGKLDAAAAQFPRYNRSGGVVVRGLTRRREAERALFLLPVAATEAETDEPMPQSVDHPVPAVTAVQAVAQSPTIGAAGVGIAASAVQAGSSLWSWITDAGQQISAAKEASGPFSDLLSAMHINVTSVTLAITIGALAFVAVRHFAKKREGLA